MDNDVKEEIVEDMAFSRSRAPARPPKERPEGEVRWIKRGGGTFRTKKGRIIKPQQKFWAHPDDIPEGFRDVVTPLVDIPEEPPLEVVESKYSLQVADDDGLLFNVVDALGKIVNEALLSKEAAEHLIKEIS